jgi:phytoene synthase
MCALYAFSRRADDLADDNQPVAERRLALQCWRMQLDDALGGKFTEPLLPALIDTVDRYSMPPQYLYDILDGVTMDLEPIEFATFDELRDYCYLVASSVGLACIHIWGFRGPTAKDAAIDCGIAFQLTNIIRDIHEDAQRHRLYLPYEDLQQFGCAVEQLSSGDSVPEWTHLVQFEIERARQYYRQGAALLPQLGRDGRPIFRLMMGTYWHLLRKLQRRASEVYQRRLSIGSVSRASIAISTALPWSSMNRELFP